MHWPSLPLDARPARRSAARSRVGLWVLIIGLLQGLLYTFWIPPWWHYDEPSRFQLAWQLAHLDHWPKSGELSPTIHRAVVRSMLRYDWYRHYPRASWPDLDAPPPYFKARPESTREPLYHLVVAMALQGADAWPVEAQLYLARAVSVLLLLGTLAVLFQLLREVGLAQHPLRWLAPVALALLPGFLDFMTAVGDDAGAALVGIALTWLAVRVWRRGWRGTDGVALVLTAVAGFWTKRTVWPLLALLPLVAWLRLPRRWRLPLFVGGTLAVLAGLAWALRWGDPAAWHRHGSPATAYPTPARMRLASAPVGDWAFALAPDHVPEIGQWLPADAQAAARGQTLTWGGWLWAEQPTQVQLPQLCHRLDCPPPVVVSVSAQPRFYTATVTLPPGMYPRLAWTPRPTPATTVYGDGFVLAVGAYQGRPDFADPQGRSGTWDGRPFVNLLRNGSAERGWFYLHPAVHARLNPQMPGEPEVMVAALQDWPGTARYQRALLVTLNHTFWGYLARYKVPLADGEALYRLLLALAALGILGLVRAWRRAPRRWPGAVLALLGYTALVPWVVTWLRGVGTLLEPELVLPWARYAAPAFPLTVAALVAGWYAWWPTRLAARVPPARGLLAFFVALDLLALYSLGQYFHPRWREAFAVLGFLLLVGAVALALQVGDIPPAGPARKREA